MRYPSSSTGEGSSNGTLFGIDASMNSVVWNYESGEVYFGTNNQRRMTINSSGHVGIGTTIPSCKLDIYNTGDQAELLRLSTDRPWVFRQTNAGALSQLDLHSTVDEKIFKISSPNAITVAQFLVSNNPSSNKVSLVPEGGNVGIGTTTPNYKLEVAGNIRSTEVKVEAQWWDEVFEDSYDLLPLPELKSYVNTYRHLPEIPTEEEVEADGVELGNMTSLLLKKIEEMTLYQIQLMEEMEKLKAQVAELQAGK